MALISPCRCGSLGFAHLDAREMRDAADGVEIDGHRKLLKTPWKRARPYTSPIFGWQTAMRDRAGHGRLAAALDAVGRLARRP